MSFSIQPNKLTAAWGPCVYVSNQLASAAYYQGVATIVADGANIQLNGTDVDLYASAVVNGSNNDYKYDIGPALQELFAQRERATGILPALFLDLDNYDEVNTNDIIAAVRLSIEYFELQQSGGLITRTTSGVTETSNQEYFLNAAPNYLVEQNLDRFDIATSGDKLPLTNKPESEFSLNDSAFLAFFVSSATIESIRIQLFEADGSLYGTAIENISPTANYVFGFTIGPKQINQKVSWDDIVTTGPSGPNIIDSNVAYYTVDIGSGTTVVGYTAVSDSHTVHIKDYCDDSLTVHFKNRVGAVDSFVFDRSYITEAEPSGFDFYKPFDDSYSTADYGGGRYATSEILRYIATTYNVQKQTANWLRELGATNRLFLQIEIDGVQSYVSAKVISNPLRTQNPVTDWIDELTFEFEISREEAMPE